MGTSYYGSAAERREADRAWQKQLDAETARLDGARQKISAKIVMALVDRIVNEIIRPGPKPEERECYEVAGELRALTPDLEALVKQIIDVNDGVE